MRYDEKKATNRQSGQNSWRILTSVFIGFQTNKKLKDLQKFLYHKMHLHRNPCAASSENAEEHSREQVHTETNFWLGFGFWRALRNDVFVPLMPALKRVALFPFCWCLFLWEKYTTGCSLDIFLNLWDNMPPTLVSKEFKDRGFGGIWGWADVKASLSLCRNWTFIEKLENCNRNSLHSGVEVFCVLVGDYDEWGEWMKMVTVDIGHGWCCQLGDFSSDICRRWSPTRWPWAELVCC